MEWNKNYLKKKTGVLKFIWKLKSQKLNLKIGILRKIFENMSFEN